MRQGLAGWTGLRGASGLRARLAAGQGDLDRALALRAAAFRPKGGSDADALDATADHVLIEGADGRPRATFRIGVFAPDDLSRSYCAQSYDLAPLTGLGPAPMVEVGRVCLAPGAGATDTLRLALAALIALADQARAGAIFGCASFPGANPRAHGPALASLLPHIGPPGMTPLAREGLPGVALGQGGTAPDTAGLPALLRLYLGLGAWVGPQAVIDRDLDTLHVFTLLARDALAPALRRRLSHPADG